MSVLPHLIVDSGNLLFKHRTVHPKTQPEMLTAGTIQQAYKTMGYDAVAVSGADLAAGATFFENSEKINFPWISANIFDTSGKLLFKPFIIKKIGEISVGIVGLTGPGKYINEAVTVSDWKEPLHLQLRNLIPKTDMIILLSNIPSSQTGIIVEKFPEVDLIFTADRNRGNLAPYIAGNALITQIQGRGKYLGKLAIQYHPEGKWFEDIALNQPTRTTMVNSYKSYFIPIRPNLLRSQKINKLKRQ